MWYIGKLCKGEPFSSLSFGDGELLAASGARTGQRMAHGDFVSQQLSDEIRVSLDVLDEDLLHATDPHLVEAHTYQGGDREWFWAMAREYDHIIKGREIVWFDGTIWEECCRSG